jgi:hypothetical protein
VSPQYAFRVTGRLTPALIRALDPLQAIAVSTETHLMGQVADRAELRGLLARIEAFDLDLTEVQRLPRRAGQASGAEICPYCHHGRAADTTSGAGAESRIM